MLSMALSWRRGRGSGGERRDFAGEMDGSGLGVEIYGDKGASYERRSLKVGPE